MSPHCINYSNFQTYCKSNVFWGKSRRDEEHEMLYQAHGLLNNNLDNKIENVHFNLMFHREETGQARVWPYLCR